MAWGIHFTAEDLERIRVSPMPAHLGAGWLPRVDPAGGPVRVVIHSRYA